MGEPFGGSLDRGLVNGGLNTEDELHCMYRSSWYFSKEEIEKNSPSRKDGIDRTKESQLRMFYCSFLRDIGIKLHLSQVTVATAIVYCHRFYLHQSHAKNDWQTVATACMFLASKVEETPCHLDKIVVVAYETMHKSDPCAAGRIREKATFQKQKNLILIGERVLLSTIRFDFNVLHPYKPLLEALKKLGITQKEVRRTAWNLVNDWLWTTFYVQYKPHYIAAGSLFLAAKLHNVKLPSERGYIWWHEFDIVPRQLEGAIHEMWQLLQCNGNSSITSVGQLAQAPVAIDKKQLSSSPDSVLRTTCISGNSSNQDSDTDRNNHKHTDSVCHIQASFSSSEKKQIYLEGRMGPQCHKTGIDIPTAAVKHNGASVDKQSMRKREHIWSMSGEIDKDRIRPNIKRKREREVPVVEPSSKKQL